MEFQCIRTRHRMWWVRTKHQFRIGDASQDRLPEIQSSLVREIFQRKMGQTNSDCRSQIFISTNAPRQQRSLVEKEDEFQDWSVWRNKKPKKRTVSFVEDRSLTWSTSTSWSLEPMIPSRIMPTYLQLFFEMMIFRSSIRNGTEFYYQWQKSHLMTSWRVWETQDRIGIVRPGDSSEESRTWLSQIEDNGEKKCRARFTKQEFWDQKRKLMRETPWSRIQGQNSVDKGTLGDCWQWKANGQCSKGDNCSFRHDINKRAKLTQPNPSPSSLMQQNERNASRTRSLRGKSPSGGNSRWLCKDYLKGTCTNLFCEKWHPPECLFYKTKSGCRFGEKCSYAHRQVDEQPSKRSKKNGDNSAVVMLKKHEQYDRTGKPVVYDSSNTRQLGCVFQDTEPPKDFIDFTEELIHAEETNPMCKIHESRCTSRRHSRPKSFALNDLPRWTSSA